MYVKKYLVAKNCLYLLWWFHSDLVVGQVRKRSLTVHSHIMHIMLFKSECSNMYP